MQISIESTETDPRIFNVTMDFTGYWPGIHYKKLNFYGYANDVEDTKLDQLLAYLKLRRISYWRIDRDSLTRHHKVERYVRYMTTVISDR